MVLRCPDRIATLQEAFDGAGELAAVRVEDGEVLQSGVPLRWGCATLAVPCVQTYVVVVIPAARKEAPGRPKSEPYAVTSKASTLR